MCLDDTALVRAFGPEMAEVPLLATRHELQGNALGPALLHSIEEALQQAGVTAVIMPALPLSEGLSTEAPLAPEHTTATAVRPKPWGMTMGYKMALPAQLLEACKMPMVQLPGTCYLIKQLSRQSLTKVSHLAPTVVERKAVGGWIIIRGTMEHSMFPCPGVKRISMCVSSTRMSPMQVSGNHRPEIS